MALRPAPKRKVDYEKLDDLQKEIFGSEEAGRESPAIAKSEDEISAKTGAQSKQRTAKLDGKSTLADKTDSQPATGREDDKNPPSSNESAGRENSKNSSTNGNLFGEHLSDMETVAACITSMKAGQGRNTTRPFSLPRTLIIDTTRLKAKFRTIDEQFTQNVIVDFLLREALAAATPENYKDLRASAFEFIKRPDETTRRSLTVTEEVVYQMSELKAGINLETGRKYSNDEIFSTLLALGVSWLYRNNILS